jgi:hypothetical protein
VEELNDLHGITCLCCNVIVADDDNDDARHGGYSDNSVGIDGRGGGL